MDTPGGAIIVGDVLNDRGYRLVTYSVRAGTRVQVMVPVEHYGAAALAAAGEHMVDVLSRDASLPDDWSGAQA